MNPLPDVSLSSVPDVTQFLEACLDVICWGLLAGLWMKFMNLQGGP